MKPIDDLWWAFSFELEDEKTASKMEQWLHARYPEAIWHVKLVESKISVSVEFNTPEEQSFYMLKWA